MNRTLISRSVLWIGISIAMWSSAHAAPQNLIINGNFSDIKENAAVGWSHTPPAPEIVTVEFPTEEKRGTFATVNLLRSGDQGAYFYQTVTVEPQTRYRLSLLARMDEGKITIAATGSGGETKLSERLVGQARSRLTMFPLFWEEKWSKFLVFDANVWRPVTLEFNSGDLTRVAISFGAYFARGSYSFDDVTLEKID